MPHPTSRYSMRGRTEHACLRKRLLSSSLGADHPGREGALDYRQGQGRSDPRFVSGKAHKRTPDGRRATRRGSSRRGPPEGLPQLGVLKNFLLCGTEKTKHGEMRRRTEKETQGASNPPGWIFWSWGSRSAPGALLGGVRAPPIDHC